MNLTTDEKGPKAFHNSVMEVANALCAKYKMEQLLAEALCMSLCDSMMISVAVQGRVPELNPEALAQNWKAIWRRIYRGIGKDVEELQKHYDHIREPIMAIASREYASKMAGEAMSGRLEGLLALLKSARKLEEDCGDPDCPVHGFGKQGPKGPLDIN